MPPDATTTTGTTTTTATTTAATPWYQGVPGVDDAMVGYLQNQGWHLKSAPEAAVAATKAWKEAERFVGAPANQIIRLPTDVKDEAGWNAAWQRLGKPTDAKGYDFTAIKNADGTPLDADTDAFMRDQAFKLNLPKDTAAALTQEMVKRDAAKSIAAKVESDARLAVEKTALATNWGANFEANKFVAGRAAAALGVDPATVAALENVIGYAKIMEMFRTIGSKIGEDKFVNSTSSGGAGVMTKEQATAQKKELMADNAWVKSYNEGDAVKGRQMRALNVLISS